MSLSVAQASNQRESPENGQQTPIWFQGKMQGGFEGRDMGFFPNTNQIQPIVNRIINEEDLTFEFERGDVFHMYTSLVSQKWQFRTLLAHLIIPNHSKKARYPYRALVQPTYQLIRIIQHILYSRMRTINKHIDAHGINRLTYSHFECVTYIFQSLDLLQEKLQNSERSSTLIDFIDAYYDKLKADFDQITKIIKWKVPKEIPRGYIIIH